MAKRLETIASGGWAPHEGRGKGAGPLPRTGGRRSQWVAQMVDRWWIRGKEREGRRVGGLAAGRGVGNLALRESAL